MYLGDKVEIVMKIYEYFLLEEEERAWEIMDIFLGVSIYISVLDVIWVVC